MAGKSSKSRKRGNPGKKGKRKKPRRVARQVPDPSFPKPLGKTHQAARRALARQELERLGVDLPKPLDLTSFVRDSQLTPVQIADEVAMKYGAEKQMLPTIEAKWLAIEGNTIRIWRRGIVLADSSGPVAIICPTHASFANELKPIKGVFTRPGAHWRRLWRRVGIDRGRDTNERRNHDSGGFVDLRQAGRARRGGVMELVIDLEDRVDRAAFATALDSTRRLREERSLALPVPASIETDSLSVRFEPVVSDAGAPAVPFEYRTDTGFTHGAIYLASPENPLAIGVSDGPEALWGPAAVVALSAYADLTCLQVDERQGLDRDQQHPASGTGPRRRSSSSGGQGADPERNRVRSAPARKSPAIWGESLRIVGRNPLERSSIVVGHIRRLGPGREASAEAARRAREVGITLREGETWVSPHIRGQAQVGELRFEWKRDSL